MNVEHLIQHSMVILFFEQWICQWLASVLTTLRFCNELIVLHFHLQLQTLASSCLQHLLIALGLSLDGEQCSAQASVRIAYLVSIVDLSVEI